jgi:hypothetical protein
MILRYSGETYLGRLSSMNTGVNCTTIGLLRKKPDRNGDLVFVTLTALLVMGPGYEGPRIAVGTVIFVC